jgi:hypothetical protein
MSGAPMPTADKIRRRLRVKIDGTGASCTAVGPDGRALRYTARRSSVVHVALRWRALGYEAVMVRLPPRNHRSAGTLWRQFPASQAEAIQAVRELAAQRSPFASQWRRFARRLDQAQPGGAER